MKYSERSAICIYSEMKTPKAIKKSLLEGMIQMAKCFKGFVGIVQLIFVMILNNITMINMESNKEDFPQSIFCALLIFALTIIAIRIIF